MWSSTEEDAPFTEVRAGIWFSFRRERSDSERRIVAPEIFEDAIEKRLIGTT